MELFSALVVGVVSAIRRSLHVETGGREALLLLGGCLGCSASLCLGEVACFALTRVAGCFSYTMSDSFDSIELELGPSPPWSESSQVS